MFLILSNSKVLNVVGIDLFNRYDNLLLKDSLNSMDDIVYCPRINCQSPIIPVTLKILFLFLL